MKNKFLIALGATATVVAPIALVVSCGGESQDEKKQTTTQTEEVKTPQQPTNEVKQVVSETEKHSVPWSTLTKATPVVHAGQQANAQVDPLNEPFKLNDKVVDVQEDGIYLVKNDYKDGKIWNGKTKAAGQEAAEDVVKLGATQMGLVNSLMLGDGDSIYVLYDQDNNDKMTPETFNKNMYFIDTSIASDLVAENVKIGNPKSGWGNMISFIASADGHSGKLNAYFGSQNNHMSSGEAYSTRDSFDKAILNLQKQLETTYPENLKTVLDYYGVMIQDGKVVNNPAIPNHASLAFAPVFSATPIFTYERVAQNAYKITYHFDGDSRITAAHFEFDAADGSDGDQYGSLSLGDKQEWDAYLRHPEAKYQAIKNVALDSK